ncbi:hypothetical protein LSAT2_019364 [Lamellibrachia satsuma]|nr:hypothetical protein LSAT2_019364 [Lamellibrachia satsuma]
MALRPAHFTPPSRHLGWISAVYRFGPVHPGKSSIEHCPENKKALTIGETLTKPCMLDCAKLVLGEDAVNKLKQIPLSNNIIKARIEDMAQHIKDQLATKPKARRRLKVECDLSKVKLRPKKIHHRRKCRPCINAACASVPSLTEKYLNSLEQALHSTRGRGVETKLSHIRDSIYNAAITTSGKQWKSTADWFETHLSDMDPAIEAKTKQADGPVGRTLSRPPGNVATETAINDNAAEPLPAMREIDELPSEKELSEAIDRLAKGKALGSEDICPEIKRCVGFLGRADLLGTSAMTGGVTRSRSRPGDGGSGGESEFKALLDRRTTPQLELGLVPRNV